MAKRKKKKKSNGKAVGGKADVHAHEAVSYTHLTLPTIYSV